MRVTNDLINTNVVVAKEAGNIGEEFHVRLEGYGSDGAEGNMPVLFVIRIEVRDGTSSKVQQSQIEITIGVMGLDGAIGTNTC